MTNTEEKKMILDVVDINGRMQVILPEARIVGGSVQKKFTGTIGTIDEQESTNNIWADWGENNDWPTQIRKKIESVPMAGAAIQKLVAMMYGNGLLYYKNSDLQDGNSTVQRASVPVVENFIRKNRLTTTWVVAQLADYRMGMNCFSEMIMSKDGKQIVAIAHKQAEFSRLAAQNPKNLRIENLFFSPHFGTNPQPEARFINKIPLLNTWDYYFDEDYFRRKRFKKFAWHSRYETPGITYYARPWWIGLFRKGGWIDVAANVPKIVSAMQRNQVSLKYQIIIPESYFTIRHPEWDAYTYEKRKAVSDALIDELNNVLEGVDNQYRSISNIVRDMPGFKDPLGKIEIIAVDDKAKKGVWVPDSNTADAQIVQGLGLHPSQMGLAPEGGKMGAGSGSDQRESFNTGIQLNTIDQQIVLEPLNFISEFNGWGVTFMFDHTAHTTTNNQESGLVPSDNTIQVKNSKTQSGNEEKD